MLNINLRLHKNFYYILGLGAFILLFTFFILKRVPGNHQDTVATALMVDMVVTFPLAYYFLIISKLHLNKWRILFVLSCCCAVAYFTLPANQKHYVLELRTLIVVAELGVIAYAFTQIHRIWSGYKALQHTLPDTAYNLQQSFITVLGDLTTIRIMASEITILRFGLLCWRKTRQWPAPVFKFTTYKESGYVALVSVLLFVCLIELAGMHLVLLQYSHTAAYILLALSVYGIVFLVADLSAMVKSPVIIYDQHLLLRAGLRWQIQTRLGNIQSVQKLDSTFIPDAISYKGAISKSSVQVLIRFNEPVMVNQLYRKPATTRQLLMNMDDVTGFIAALDMQAQ